MPGSIDEATLERTLACYQQASDIVPKNLYSLMNAVRIKLLLAGLRSNDTDPARAEISTLGLLARYNAVSDQEGDPWARFDLASALLLSGRAAEGLAEFKVAAFAVAAESRTAILAAEAEVLSDFLTIADALSPQTVNAIRSAVEVCAELSETGA